MRKAITFVVSSVLTGLILLIALFVSIVAIPNDVFYDHYMKMLSTKYDTLKNTDSPKIIIISGSSAAFCLDGDMLADRTGMNVVNTGLHAGIGARFEAEMSKANINKGDIVLLEYEWGWATDEKYTDAFGTDLIMTGIEENIEMYRFAPFNKYKYILGYLFTFANKRRAYVADQYGAYSRAAFSSNGNSMVYQRGDSPIIKAFRKDPRHCGIIDFENPVIPESTVSYFKSYKEYVENRGASVYWICCPIYKAAVQCDYTELEKAARQIEKQIGIKYISNPIDYLFPGEYMYDTIYHTNSRGMRYSTELLANDLKRAGLIKK